MKKIRGQAPHQPITSGVAWCGDADALNLCLAVQDKYSSLSFSEQLKLQAEARDLEARMASAEDGYSSHYMIESYADGRLAVINVSGPLMAHQLPLRMFGLPVTTYGEIMSAVQQLRADANVQKVVLRINSGGGTGFGMSPAGRMLDLLAEEKGLETYSDSHILSAAYWLGSAGNKIVTEATAQVGSIGVYTTVISNAERNRQEGRDVRVVRAGEFKAANHPDEPVSDKMLAEMARIVDGTYAQFLDRTSYKRGIDREKFRVEAAEGRTFLAEEAKQVGLVDEIRDYDEYIDSLVAELSKKPAVNSARPVPNRSRMQLNHEVTMNIFDILQKLGIKLSDAQTAQLNAGADPSTIGLSAKDLARVDEAIKAAAEAPAEASAEAAAAEPQAGATPAAEGAEPAAEPKAGATPAAAQAPDAFAVQLNSVMEQLTTVSTKLGEAKVELAAALAAKTAAESKTAKLQTLLDSAKPAIVASINRMQASLRSTVDDGLEARDVADLLKLHEDVRGRFEQIFPVGRLSKTPVSETVDGKARGATGTVTTAAVDATRI